ncbi:hypothetical protein V501_08249 [Pseudogymnoascus sp. VKM F-4519 (FW-2642)]|nr:hypothetical protein V501_08249 [Pseudogymnoascus sp. VKM F-4519 (FW-2642)]
MQLIKIALLLAPLLAVASAIVDDSPHDVEAKIKRDQDLGSRGFDTRSLGLEKRDCEKNGSKPTMSFSSYSQPLADYYVFPISRFLRRASTISAKANPQQYLRVSNAATCPEPRDSHQCYYQEHQADEKHPADQDGKLADGT